MAADQRDTLILAPMELNRSMDTAGPLIAIEPFILQLTDLFLWTSGQHLF